MIRPTIEKIDKIIYKLKELQTTIANIEDRPPEFPTCDIKDNKSITIEQFIKAAAGQSFELTKNEKSKMPTNPELLAEFMDLYSPQKSFEKALRILPTLSMDNLKKLLNDDIPKLLAIDSISKKEIFPGSISSAGTSCAGPIIRDSDAMHKLKIIQFYVEQQIKKNIEAAKAARRQKHVRPLIDEIKLLLFPFWPFLTVWGSWYLEERTHIESAIKSAKSEDLTEVINEFERIKYKLEVESQQSAPQKPAETEQENKDAKREREGLIQPKPPEIFQKILWIQKYGRKHWKLVTLAILIVLCIWILSKINLFS